MHRKLGLMAALVLLVSMCGCKDGSESTAQKQPASVETASEAVSDAAQEMTDVPAVSAGINPLTGESGYNENAVGKRPVAVMVNNLTGALPQYGIEQADIIYELPVEGGITRLMAVYADFTNVPNVCSVRSCRYYYPILCLGMDAIYCHWGADQTIALDTLNRTGIDHIDGGYDETLFKRDPERVGVYSSEHTGYLDGSLLADTIANRGFRTDIYSENSNWLNFTAEERVPDEMAVSRTILNFSQDYFSTFEYDASSGCYLKYHSGNPHMDGKTGNQLGFENVLALQTSVYPREDGYLMNVELNGGSGYYFSKGGGQQITWSKAGENSPIELYDISGNPLLLNVGETYIGIIGADKFISIE